MNFNYRSVKNLSVSLSVILHIILLVAFLFLNFTVNYPRNDYVELSFGTSGKPGSSGNVGTQVNQVEELSKKEEKDKAKESKDNVKKVKLPEAKNTSDENIVKPADKEKTKADETKKESKVKTNSQETAEGKGNKAKGSGSFGYDIDWGGQGQRKIYSFNLPEYPEGVNKEIDIRLRFTILPDGTVGTIFPLIKADTRLENAAMNSLRQWRFEALDPSQKQVEQVAVIVFPYRLK
ncbi:MAG TPA: hypothetical protein VKA26_05090 [Ignavibacteriaceae bacterium]|nr:hypothetical protein [Ignavibacteriaceae bacterium]